jgi:hypothetical protein
VINKIGERIKIGGAFTLVERKATTVARLAVEESI